MVTRQWIDLFLYWIPLKSHVKSHVKSYVAYDMFTYFSAFPECADLQLHWWSRTRISNWLPRSLAFPVSPNHQKSLCNKSRDHSQLRSHVIDSNQGTCYQYHSKIVWTIHPSNDRVENTWIAGKAILTIVKLPVKHESVCHHRSAVSAFWPRIQ